MNWLRNRRTRVKLTLAFGLMAALLAAAGGLGIHSLNQVSRSFDELHRKYALGLAMLKESELQLELSTVETREALHARTPREVAARAEAATRAREEFDRQFSNYRNTADAASPVDRIEKVQADLHQIASLQEVAVEQIAGRQTGQATATVKEIDALTAAALQQMRVLEESRRLHIDGMSKRVAETEASAREKLLAIMAVSVLFAVVLCVAISGLIADPLERTVRILERVAAGDFTERLSIDTPIDTRDEVGRMASAVDNAVGRMRQTLADVSGASRGVASAAIELAGATDQLARGAHAQMGSLEQTAASLREMTTTVQRNADNARQASQLANETRRSADEGGQVVNDAVTAMAEINLASRRIEEIISAIDEIAFQTNLLALNAAVEAARAGEHGRGFAVVAAEVRSLAQRSATAAKEIKVLIRDSVDKVDRGTELVNRSGHTLQAIVEAVKRVTGIVGEIASASQQQESGIDLLGRALAQMEQVAQGNAAQTEELASTAQSLSDSSNHLQKLVLRFAIDRSGAERASQPGPLASEVYS